MGDWYRVNIPIRGVLTAFVEADSTDQAEAIALEGFQEDALEWTSLEYAADDSRDTSATLATQEELDEAMEEPDEDDPAPNDEG